MTLIIVRSNAPGCEPVCPEWISAEGTILGDTPRLFRKMFKKLGDRRLPIIIKSPGGDINAAIAIGRMVRERKLDVAVGGTRMGGCPLPTTKRCRPEQKDGQTLKGVIVRSEAYCSSACPLILAGGIRRLAGTYEFVGVHQVTTYGTRVKTTYKTKYKVVKGKKKVVSKVAVGSKKVHFETTELRKETRRKILAHLRVMGVAEAYLDISQRTKASDISRLSQHQMEKLKLITSLDDAGVLVGVEVCKATPMPVNCREDRSEIPLSRIPLPTPRPTAEGKAVVSASTRTEPLVATSKPAEPVKPRSLRPMRFVVVRADTPHCAPNCPHWISAEGTIDPAAPDTLKMLLDALPGRRLPMLIHSDGGDLDAALRMGRLVRQRGLDVAIARTRFTGCTPQETGCNSDGSPFSGVATDEGDCGSACTLVLAAGATRIAGLFTKVTVHRLSIDEAVETYLAETTVDPHMARIMRSTPASHPRLLKPLDLWRIKLVNNGGTVRELVSAAACAKEPRPDNCAPVAATTTATGADESKPVEPVKPHSITDLMRFVVVRGHSSLCAPNCPEWISAEGYISQLSLPALRKVLDSLGDRQLPILITSRGGDVATAMAMGWLLRQRKLNVAVASTNYINCKPEEPSCVPDGETYVGAAYEWGAECHASCLLILAGGVHRVAGPYVNVSVESLRDMPMVRRYLRDMGLNHMIGTLMYQSQSTRRELDWQTMREALLSTGEASVDELTGTSVCTRLPLPGNCRVVATTQ